MNKVEKITIKRHNYFSDIVPKEFDGAKIVFLSDIHHGRTFTTAKLRALVEMANALHPDIILLGGDYVDRNPDRIVTFFHEAAALSAPLGVYGVLGNHDRWTDGKLSEECMEKSGIILIDNNAVWIERGRARIRVGGVGDLSTSTQDIAPMLDGTEKGDLMILVTHNPDYAFSLPQDKIDLMFCGHTHGGQVRFLAKCVPSWPGAADLRFLSGVVNECGTTMIISNGIGTVGPPIRISAAPQIWEVTLVRAGHTPGDAGNQAF